MARRTTTLTPFSETDNPAEDLLDIRKFEDSDIDGAPISESTEVPPKIPTPTISERAKGLVEQIKTRPVRKKTTRPRKPRVGVENIIGYAWRFAAQMMAPINVPVARVLDTQAPVAGVVVEDLVKNTAVDVVLQPLARMAGGGDVVFALVGPPLLVAALTTRPASAPLLVPLLRQSLEKWIDVAGPVLEARAKKEEEFKEKYGESIDAMIAYFLSPVPGDEASSD